MELWYTEETVSVPHYMDQRLWENTLYSKKQIENVYNYIHFKDNCITVMVRDSIVVCTVIANDKNYYNAGKTYYGYKFVELTEI